MSMKGRVKALERGSGDGLCEVHYKWGRGSPTHSKLPLEKALSEARAGKLKCIYFPLSFTEEQAERAYGGDVLAEAFEEMNGIQRDTHAPGCDRLVICTKPVVYAKQAPPHGRCGGYFQTEDGTVFHQTEWDEILQKYNAGFIIVTEYDESKEPWSRRSNE